MSAPPLSTAALLHLPSINVGAAYRHRLTWLNPDNTPVNLTGCTAALQVRESHQAESALLELTTENGRISLGGIAGTIDLFIDKNITSAINWQAGKYDLLITFSNGEPTRLCEGNFNAKPAITR